MEKTKINVSNYPEQKKSCFYEVDYRSKSDPTFKRYVGIGGYCTNQDGIYSFFPKGENPDISEWREYFKTSDHAEIMLTFHEFVMAYRDNRNPKEYEFGTEIYQIIHDHWKSFNSFIDKWFEPLPKSNFFFFPPTYGNFKGLNLNIDGIEEFVEKKYYDQDENPIKVIFKDGSIMKLANTQGSDEYLNYDQFFILKHEYESFINDLIELVGYFLK